MNRIYANAGVKILAKLGKIKQEWVDPTRGQPIVLDQRLEARIVECDNDAMFNW
jgi:hypothetical protein